MDAKRNLQTLIDGDKDGSLGALQKYHRNFTYDLFSQVDRATAKTYADDLKFEFAIYEGGLIETSREFCKKHNGNVYHKSEIQQFNPKVAKPPNYNPFVDCGGYRDWETDRKSTRLNSSHSAKTRMPSSA